jgi:hydrogenase nickel incorporation protein HypA/HybF
MHEYSIVRALVDQVEGQARDHGAVAVHRVRVQIGELSGVEGDLLASAYELVRAGSPVCTGAELEIVPVPASWVCGLCGTAVEKGGRLSCPDCGAPAKLVAGEEILLERIEMEVA